MKKLMILLFVLIPVIVFGQGYQPWQGGLMDIYSTRYGTFNEKVSGLVTYVDSTDTFYTKLSNILASDGIYKIEFSSDSIDVASDSICIDVAFYNPTRASHAKWSPWKRLFTNIHTDTLYELNIDTADSTWWIPQYQRQYRLYRLDGTGDSLSAKLIDFIK